MLNEDIVKFQLERYYKDIENTRSDRQTIRKWCLTVWLAMLGVIFAGKVVIPQWQELLMAVLPLGVFWFLEAGTATHTLLLENRAKELENILLSKDYSDGNPIRFLYVSGHYFVPMAEKIRCFLIAGLRMETIVLFYLLLIGLTYVVLTLRATT